MEATLGPLLEELQKEYSGKSTMMSLANTSIL